MTSYSLPKITSLLVRYKKPLGETFPPKFPTSHCRPPFGPMVPTDSRVEQKGTQVVVHFFFLDGRSGRRSVWSVRNRHGRRTTEIKFHKVAKRNTSTLEITGTATAVTSPRSNNIDN